MGGVAKPTGVTTDLPRVFVFEEHDEDAAADELFRFVKGLGIDAPLVLSSVHGRRVSARIDGVAPTETAAADANQDWASELGSRAQEAGADAVVAVGGGRTLDIGKLAAARAGLRVVAVPTQLSHDGICSPVAVVPNDEGTRESLGAIAPTAVYISLATLFGAPHDSVAAGVGDLLANPLALRDWKLAAERGLEELDDRAWEMSVESYELIKDHLDVEPAKWAQDQGALRRLADALVLSGMAMIVSGTSRPASGGEHEISHAIDELFGGRAMHGAQVAFGCIISTALYEEDVEPLRTILRRMDLPHEPSALELSEDDLVRVLLEAPDTRPGRFTILEEANLNDAQARALVRRIWS